MKDKTMFAESQQTTTVDEDSIDLMQVFAVVRQRWHVLVLGFLAGLILGVTNVVTTTPIYTSSTHISIGSLDAESARQLSGVSGSTLDEDQITTEIQVLRSEQIAARVVDTLDLVNNEVLFTKAESGPGRIVAGLKAVLTGAAETVLNLLREEALELPVSEEELAERARQNAVAKLRAGINASQIQRSRVLNVSYTSVSPTLSAQIANAIANAYIEDQLASKYEATQRATDWLKARSDQLRIQSTMLDNAVERFRRDNKLVGVGGELESLNEQVADARSELVTLEARAKRLNEIVSQNDTSAFVSSTATQSITSKLRTQYLEILQDYNRLQSNLGEDHEQIQRRRRELTQLQGLMFEEIKRSAIIARNDVREAKERLSNLKSAQALAADQLGADNTTLVELRELERIAETIRSLYTSFLQRYQQSLQEQSFPVSDARVLNPARVPRSASSPGLTKTAALAGILGLMLAAGWIAIREVLDNKLRTEEQIRNKLGLEFFGGLDKLTVKKTQAVAQTDQLRPGEVRFPEIMRYGAEEPLSAFSETLRTGKMSVTLKSSTGDSGQVIGIVSSFLGEGKTTTAANFAGLLAAQGARVMLVDGDMRNIGLTRALAGDIELGLVDILLEGARWQDVIYLEKETGTHIIPNRRGRVVHTSELLGGPEMKALISECATNYDYVIIDLPPLVPVIDARAVLHNLDGLFFIAKWGTTNVNHAANILRSDPRLRSKCYGAFFNMYDAHKASAYGGYEGVSYYYGTSYDRSYHDR